MLLSADIFLFLYYLPWLLQRIKNTFYLFYWWDSLMLFCFLCNQENIYMIHHYSDLLYDIYSKINEHNRRQTHYVSSVQNYFKCLFLSESKSSFITPLALSLIMISMLSLFKCITLFIIIYGSNNFICFC